MSKYYERNDLDAFFDRMIDRYEACPDKYDAAVGIKGASYAIPSINEIPVRRGCWVWDPDGMDWGLGAWCCSSCKTKAETWWANDRKYNPLHCAGGHFCGNCGAQMVT